MKRQSKTQAQDALAWLAIGALTLALTVGGLWWWAGTWELATLRAVVTVAPFALGLAFGAGFYFGKVEVRGFLGGFDRALDGVSKAVDLRDNSRVRTAQAARRIAQPARQDLNVFLPNGYSVPLSHREVGSGAQQIIDL